MLGEPEPPGQTAADVLWRLLVELQRLTRENEQLQHALNVLLVRASLTAPGRYEQ